MCDSSQCQLSAIFEPGRQIEEMSVRRMPSLDEWLAEAKLDESALNCGMYLVHNGVVRQTAKREVRENAANQKAVCAVDFSYDAEGVQQAVEETFNLPGVYFVRVWLNAGCLAVGESLMVVLVGADIRPRCIEAFEFLVEKIKSELVVERELTAQDLAAEDCNNRPHTCANNNNETAAAR